MYLSIYFQRGVTLNLFEGIEFNSMQFIGPILILFATIFGIAIIYRLLFIKLLPQQIFNFFIGPVALLGFYIWVVPMKLGFYDFFK